MNLRFMRFGVSVCTAVFVLVIALDAPALARVPLVSGYLLLCPGWVWVRRIPLLDRGDQLALTVALSVCSWALVGGGLALGQSWVVWRGVVGVAALTTLGDVLPSRQQWAQVRSRRGVRSRVN